MGHQRCLARAVGEMKRRILYYGAVNDDDGEEENDVSVSDLMSMA